MNEVRDIEVGSEIGRGTRVKIYSSRVDKEREGALRVPHDLKKDGMEIANLRLLEQYLAEFLPNPEVMQVAIGDSIRNLIFCERIYSPFLTSVPKAQFFRAHFDSLPNVEAKARFLHKLRRFVDQCKRLFYDTSSLPDLVGKGNLISQGTDIYLLDFNNTTFDRHFSVGGDIRVPLDDRGDPVFDLSLHLLYHLEKELLSSRANSPASGRLPALAPADKAQAPFVDFGRLKQEPFYGALRFRARREKVKEIMREVGCVVT